MNVLIVGSGVAGPTLAYWLAHHGHAPTLLERAPELRTGGYVIDFWGAAFDVAEQMQLVPELRRRGYVIDAVRIVDDDGDVAGGFSAEVFARLSGGRYVSLPRGELAAAIFERLDARTETLFGDEITSLEETADDVRVTLARGGARTFDLVVGADGLHSDVRARCFGEESSFEKYLGYEVAAVEVDGYRPRDEGAYVLHAEPGRQIGRFAMRGDRTMFLFVWSEAQPQPIPRDLAGRLARLRERFGSAAWEVPRILDAAAEATDIYMDRVSQIRMDRWTRGRVALVGDAAHCVSLLAGQGSALAMLGARVLAGELGSTSDFEAAFARYEERLTGFIGDKQRAASRFAGSFAPRTKIGLAIRNQMTRLLSVPFVADFALGRGLQDALELPDYG